MDKIEKALARFSKDDYLIAFDRKVRVIFEVEPRQMPEIRVVDRRSDNTYKKL